MTSNRSRTPRETAGQAATRRALEQDWVRDLRQAALVCVSTVAFVAGLLAKLTGAPDFLSLGLGGVGLVGLLLANRVMRAERRQQALADDDRARSLEAMETMADRMWELQESEERFRGLIDALGDLVVHRDRDGRIVYTNAIFAGLFDAEPRELAGRTLSELGIDVGIVPDAAFAEGECLSSTDVAIQTASGTRWFSWIELSVRDKDDGTVSHRAIARDITARKRAEKATSAARERAEDASRAKSRFLATVSHEIRTPMNGIQGMAKLLADTELTPEQQTYVGAVSTSAAALLALIEDLLDFSKIEAGRFELEPQPTSAREVAENVVELLASRAYAKGIGLGCHVAPDVPSRIEADPGRLRQVLLNLVGNAIKFTDEGGVLVTVDMVDDGQSRQLRFSVRDTGPGLAPQGRERIFDEFEQADGTSTRKHGGAGLGLAISRRIAAAMGGSLGVESEQGRGSVFSLQIPAPVVEDEVFPAAAGILADTSVVILSRSMVEADAIATTIRAYGGFARLARTPEEAADRLAESRASAVLIDAGMETPDGDMLRRIRELTGPNVDALTLIAPTDRGRLAEFRNHGYSTFLARPVRGATLLRVLLAPENRLSTAGAHGARTMHKPPRPMAGQALSILLAEDNEINAMLARVALTRAGHAVEVVGNGKAAVDALVDPALPNRFDLVLMDLHMPVMDGVDAIAMIRKYEDEKGLAPIPILVLSADGQEATRHGVLAHGASGFVTKPIDPAVLVQTVEQRAAA